MHIKQFFTSMLKNPVYLAVEILFVVLVLFLVFLPPQDTLSINNTDIKIERAVTDKERAIGLGEYERLDDDSGLLFEFEQSDTHGIWMKDVEFPIDVVWLDSSKKIVHIEVDMQPDSYPTVFHSDEPALYVLELPAGFVVKHGIKEGQRAEFEL